MNVYWKILPTVFKKQTRSHRTISKHKSTNELCAAKLHYNSAENLDINFYWIFTYFHSEQFNGKWFENDSVTTLRVYVFEKHN